jgi:hypothetical protein
MTNIEMMHHSTLFSSSIYYVDELYNNFHACVSEMQLLNKVVR